MPGQPRTLGFWIGAIFFAAFVLFLYGPLSAIFVLSFQGPDGGLTFPMNGVSLRWFGSLLERQMVGNLSGATLRSVELGGVVMLATMVISLMAGLAFRRRFRGATALF